MSDTTPKTQKILEDASKPMQDVGVGQPEQRSTGPVVPPFIEPGTNRPMEEKDFKEPEASVENPLPPTTPNVEDLAREVHQSEAESLAEERRRLAVEAGKPYSQSSEQILRKGEGPTISERSPKTGLGPGGRR